jgi:hypothetical protein
MMLERFRRTAKRCPRCGGKMKVIVFITDAAVVVRIIDHLKLTFAAERPPPECAFQDLMVADPPAEYFSLREHHKPHPEI